MNASIQFRHETTALVSPQELGRLFAQMDDQQQADFFEAAAECKGMDMQGHYIGDRLCERGREGKAWQFVANLCSSVLVHSWRYTVRNLPYGEHP
jgi:hypothetical protein